MVARLFPAVCLTATLLFPSAAARASDPVEKALPAELSPAIDHLIGQLTADGQSDPDPDRIAPLIEFVLTSDSEELRYETRDRQGMTSSYLGLELNSDLHRLMRYLYNPDIPSHVFSPSSVRFTRWMGDSGRTSMPRLWEKEPGPRGVAMVRGTEHEEITPNLATGTYFAYDLERALIFLHWQGRPVLISLSRQLGRSEVGRKGEVLGADGDWNYLYSDDKGIGITGLGWADAYMYDSVAINIFCETGEGAGLRSGSFKWLKAGWGGINLVRRHHIQEGQVRYARDLKMLLENDPLPAPESLAASFQRLEQLSDRDLQRFASRYLDRLQRHFGGEDSGLSKKMAGLLDGAYLEQTSRQEMVAVLAVN